MTFTGFPKDVVDVTTASASGYWLHEVSQIERQMALQVAQRRLRVADSPRRFGARRPNLAPGGRGVGVDHATYVRTTERAHARARLLSRIAVRLEPRG